MRLIGSMTEQKYRDALIASSKRLFENDRDTRLLDALRATFGDIKTAYVISHIPEQAEDIYTILVNRNRVARVEVSRCNRNEQPILEVIDIKELMASLSKVGRIKLTIATELAQSDLEERS